LVEIAKVTVQRLEQEYKARSENLRIAIGAAAGGCCYEVGEEVIDAFKSKSSKAQELFTETRPGHAMVDLIKANRDQLIEAGVREERIHVAPLCTMCRTDLFFSYRKEKRLHGKVGRLMAVVGRRP
jgi:copper oxidase (laccase) domain-containing protein